MRLDIIGLAGRAGSGKNFLAETYFRPRGFYPVALADHGKMTAVGRGVATLEEVMVTKPPAVRDYLQQELTERGRHVYGADVWSRTTYAWMCHWAAQWGVRRFVVTDVRFPEEIDFLHEREGVVYYVDAPRRVAAKARQYPAKLNAHVSETALLGSEHLYDGVLSNDPEFAGSVERQIDGLLRAHRLSSAAASP